MEAGADATRSKATLLAGDVRPWHVVFIFFVAWSVGIVGGFKAMQGTDPGVRGPLQYMAIQAIAAAILLAFTAIVPELRRSLHALFIRPSRPVSLSDMAWTFAAMLCWGYGIYRVAVCLPIAWLDLSFRHLFVLEALPPFDWTYLAFFTGTLVLAPFAEELFFRGYLLNLWAVRWGNVGALMLSSILFGLFHWQNAIFAAPLGFAFGLVYLRYDSLWPGVVLHGLYNLFAFPWILGGLFYVRPHALTHQLATWAPEIVMSLLAIPVIIVFLRRFWPDSPTRR